MAFRTDVNPPSGSYSYSLGEDGKEWILNGHDPGYIEIDVELKSQDGQTLTISDSRITSDHVVLDTIAISPVGYVITPTE